MIEAARVRVVSFDAAGTLFRPYPSVGAVYGEVLREVGLKADLGEVEASFRQAFTSATRLPRRNLSEAKEKVFWFEIVQSALRPWVATAPATAGGDLFERCFIKLWGKFSTGEHWLAFDDVAAVLEALRQKGLRRVVLSNADARFHRVLADLDLAGSFEHVFLSTELGVEKPLPEAYRAVEAAMGVPAEAILHIGDRVGPDFDGPRAAGWQAILLDRDHGHPDLTPRMQSLGELEGLLCV